MQIWPNCAEQVTLVAIEGGLGHVDRSRAWSLDVDAQIPQAPTGASGRLQAGYRRRAQPSLWEMDTTESPCQDRSHHP